MVGDALARLLDYAGHDVTKEYYVNDGGAQVDVLARSSFERYREACGMTPEIGEGLYPGDYLVPVGEKLKERWGEGKLNSPESDWLEEAREIATEAMMEMIRADLAARDPRLGGPLFGYASGRAGAAAEDLLLQRGRAVAKRHERLAHGQA